MSDLKISVITVAFSSVRTMRDTLVSVSLQDYPSVEHIIVDGGSEDGTMELVKYYLREGGLAISEPDSGLYDAMNKGVMLSTGDVIGFLNSDDIFQSESVLTDVAEVFADQTVSAVYGDLVYFSDSEPNTDRGIYSSAEFSAKKLASGWMPAHPTLYVRRSVMNAVGPFRLDFRIASDFEFCLRLFNLPNVYAVYLPKKLVRMRLGGLSTRNLTSKYIIALEVNRALRLHGLKPSWVGILGRYLKKLAGFSF